MREKVKKEKIKKGLITNTFRVSEDSIDRVDAIASKTQRSRCQVVRLLFEYGLASYEQGHVKL